MIGARFDSLREEKKQSYTLESLKEARFVSVCLYVVLVLVLIHSD